MTESVEVGQVAAPIASPPVRDHHRNEIATLPCARCRQQKLPWDLKTFGDKAICIGCYDATLELARGAIRAMPSNEKDRLCSNCRALQNPSFGSAWCAVTELGDVRARICANFVSVEVEAARVQVTGGRVGLLDLWECVSNELRMTLGPGNYQTWFDHVEPVSLEGNVLHLAAPDDHVRDWIEQRLDPVVRNALAMAGYPEIVPEYRVDLDLAGDDQINGDELAKAKLAFNPHYTFGEFIVGSGNRLAHASALACVDKPGQVYNPLVLYGGVGVGKTHLLQAIGQEVVERGLGRVLYTTSETFTNELISAIRDGSTGEFRERYRTADFLLLDDIQFIAGKEATQEEFFHTFNSLHQSGKQIVVTSDRPPTELRTLEARLRSRFAWGLTADIQPPDFETRVAILRSKAAVKHRRLPETVLDALGARGGNNVRELEGALNRVFALADMLGTEPGMEIVRTVLGDPGADDGCGPEDIIQAVAAYYHVKPSELTGPQRERKIAYARHMAMFLLREEAKLSLVEVGNCLGGRNHSTVIYSCDKIALEVRRKGRVKQDVQAIKQLVYGVR